MSNPVPPKHNIADLLLKCVVGPSDFRPFLEAYAPQYKEPRRHAGDTTLVLQPRPMRRSPRYNPRKKPLLLDRRGHPKEHRVRLTRTKVSDQDFHTKEQSETIMSEKKSVGPSTDMKLHLTILQSPGSRTSVLLWITDLTVCHWFILGNSLGKPPQTDRH